MRRFIWVGAAVGVAFWTTLCWLTHGVIDVLGSTVATMGATPGFAPEPFTWAWAATIARSFGLNAVLAVWAIGAAGILGAAWFCESYLRRRKRKRQARFEARNRSWGSTYRVEDERRRRRNREDDNDDRPRGHLPFKRLDLDDVIKSAKRRFARR